MGPAATREASGYSNSSSYARELSSGAKLVRLGNSGPTVNMDVLSPTYPSYAFTKALMLQLDHPLSKPPRSGRERMNEKPHVLRPVKHWCVRVK